MRRCSHLCTGVPSLGGSGAVLLIISYQRIPAATISWAKKPEIRALARKSAQLMLSDVVSRKRSTKAHRMTSLIPGPQTASLLSCDPWVKKEPNAPGAEQPLHNLKLHETHSHGSGIRRDHKDGAQGEYGDRTEITPKKSCFLMSAVPRPHSISTILPE